MSQTTELGLHLRLSLTVPATVARPLPTEMEVIVNLPSITTAAHMDQVLGSIGKLLDGYAQAIAEHHKQAIAEHHKAGLSPSQEPGT